MSYYFNAIINDATFDDVITLVTEELQKHGFGVLNEINLQRIFKKKLEVDFQKYVILGACHPTYAHRAILEADKIGLFLPCNVVVEEHKNGDIEVAIINPLVSMSSIKGIKLEEIALEIRNKLLKVIEALKKAS